uniref:Inositol-1-monophosphatase n=1 Tax=Ceratitis capitata TaxID=7213 RepID=W8BBR5_CERCA
MSDISENQRIRNYYNVALKLVMKCGPVACAGYEEANIDFETKSAYYDFVTIYDKQVEDLLIAGLQTAFPETKVIGEESTAEDKSEPVLTDAPTWIIDPIDGTTNFIRRFPNWCISVGLAIKKQLVIGIVYLPVVNEMYSAYKGHGAYLNGQRISVSKCTKINTAVLGTELSLIQRPAIRDKHVKRVSKLASNCSGCRGIGSAAVTLCYVARGSIDCFAVEDLQPWDIAGGACIIREAGGIVCHSKGGEFSILKPDCIAAATPELTKDMIALINEADELKEFTF